MVHWCLSLDINSVLQEAQALSVLLIQAFIDDHICDDIMMLLFGFYSFN